MLDFRALPAHTLLIEQLQSLLSAPETPAADDWDKLWPMMLGVWSHFDAAGAARLSNLRSDPASPLDQVGLPFLLDPRIAIEHVVIDDAPTLDRIVDGGKVPGLSHDELLAAPGEAADKSAAIAMSWIKERRRFPAGEGAYHAAAALYEKGLLNGASAKPAPGRASIRPVRLCIDNTVIAGESISLRGMLEAIEAFPEARRFALAKMEPTNDDPANEEMMISLYAIRITPKAREFWKEIFQRIVSTEKGAASRLTGELVNTIIELRLETEPA